MIKTENSLDLRDHKRSISIENTIKMIETDGVLRQNPWLLNVPRWLRELKRMRCEVKHLRRELAKAHAERHIRPDQDPRTVDEVLRTLTKSQREVVEFLNHDLMRENEILRERIAELEVLTVAVNLTRTGGI